MTDTKGKSGATQSGSAKPAGAKSGDVQPTEDKASGGGLDTILTKATEMRDRVSKVQGEIAGISASASVADGKVEVTCDGNGALKDLRIDPSLMDGDASVLQELILKAAESARLDAKGQAKQKMTGALDDLPLPGAIGRLVTQFLPT